MKILSNIKRSVYKALALAMVTTAVVGVAMATKPADAASGYDCDANAVVYCGADSAASLVNKYNNGDTKNSAASINHIYDWFGISANDISSFKNDAVTGSVTKSGNVYVGNTLVATNALTAGRQNIAGSTQRSDGGTTFYTRPPSVSFLSSSLSAMVVMKNGVFQFAVLNSCGNPVKATPKTPNYTVQKQVSVKGDDNFKSNVTVNAGDHVVYKVTVTSTGDVAAKNINVNDNLPKDMTEVSNSLTRNDPGAPVQNGNDANFFGNGVNISSLDPGQSVVFKFEAVAGKTNDTDPTCKAETLTNEADINAPGLPKKTDTAVVNTTCKTPPAPAYACTNLTSTVDAGNPLKFNFGGQANATNGAKITSYHFDFGDGKSTDNATNLVATSTSHTYASAGTYNAVLTVHFNVNGQDKTDTGAACKVTVKPQQQVQPVYACDNLTAVPNSRTQYTFKATADASNGATITGYTFNFGDGTVQSVATTATSTSLQHTYAAPGTYATAVDALIKVNGQIVNAHSAACKTYVTVTQSPAAECTGLTLSQGNDQLTFSGAATYTTSGGATFTGASINWGDGTSSTSQKGGPGVADFDAHSYATPGTYTAVATLTFSGATPATSTCQAVVTPQGQQPVYSCDAFQAVLGDNRTVNVTTFHTTATNGATFTSADINWGDNSAVTSTATPVGQSHTYAADGTYTIQAVAHFMVNGVDVTAGGVNCQTTVGPKTPPCTPPTTGTPPHCVPPVCTPPTTGTPPNCVTPPTTLVNTGAGNVIGLFAGVSILGTLFYRWSLARKLSQN